MKRKINEEMQAEGDLRNRIFDEAILLSLENPFPISSRNKSLSKELNIHRDMYRLYEKLAHQY